MAYTAWSVVFGEQPSTAKWNILGTNDAHFYGMLGDSANPVVQVASTNFSAVATGTTALPRDNSIPQNTEGTEFMTQAITPKSSSNILLIEAVAHASSNTAESISIALFQDSTTNALAANGMYIDTITGSGTFVLTHKMTAGTTSATTFKIRMGGNTGVTVSFNGASGVRLYGGITNSNLKITEVKG